MGVNTDHHLTEAGLIPADWNVRNIRSFASIKTGPFGTLLKASEYTEGDGVPLISVGEVREGYFRVTPETPKVCEKVTRRLPQYLLRTGDIVFGRKGGVERSALVTEQQTGWFLGSDGIAVRPDGTVFSPYLARQFQTTRVRNWLLQNSTGTTMPSLNQAILGGVVVALPPMRAEQEAIAGALADADGWIESLEKLIAKKRQIKLGVMQQLLTGKRRLPGFSGEWEEKRLGDIGESLIGLTYSPSEVRESGTLVLRSSNIQNGALDFEDCVFVQAEIPERIIVRPGDILICVRNGSRDLIGKCAKIDARAVGMTFGAFMAVFRTAHHDFIFHQMRSDAVMRQIKEHLGATINQITNASLNSLRVPFPLDPDERFQLSALMTDMDAEVAALGAKLAKARLLKEGMMQTLLTGKVRLV